MFRQVIEEYPSELLTILSGQLLSYQKSAIAPFICAGLKKLSLAKNFGDLPFNVSIKLKIFNTFNVEEKQFWQVSSSKAHHINHHTRPWQSQHHTRRHKMAPYTIL
jgi:hypothetical protein